MLNLVLFAVVLLWIIVPLILYLAGDKNNIKGLKTFGKVLMAINYGIPVLLFVLFVVLGGINDARYNNMKSVTEGETITLVNTTGTGCHGYYIIADDDVLELSKTVSVHDGAFAGCGTSYRVGSTFKGVNPGKTYIMYVEHLYGEFLCTVYCVDVSDSLQVSCSDVVWESGDIFRQELQIQENEALECSEKFGFDESQMTDIFVKRIYH